MRKYFEASNALNRFSKSMIKKYTEEITKPIHSSLAIVLDDDFKLTGKNHFPSGKQQFIVFQYSQSFLLPWTLFSTV